MAGDALETALRVARHYPGRVEWVLIQFPTPFLLPGDGDDASDDHHELRGVESGKGFLLTAELVDVVVRMRAKHFLVSTFLEDIADRCDAIVRTQDALKPVRIMPLSEQGERSSESKEDAEYTHETRTPQRTARWRARQGAAHTPRRAPTSQAAAASLPRQARTETEAMCDERGIPVFRLLYEQSVASTY